MVQVTDLTKLLTMNVTMTKWLNSGCDLGKDLRAKREISKLVKHKEYRVLLCVLILLESTWGNY